MSTRRGGRPSQVRPRPPSNGRPQPVRVRPISPSPRRLSPHRRVERRRGLPLVAQALLAVAVVALGASVLWVSSGGIGTILAGLGTAIGGAIDDVRATSSPSPTPVGVIPDAPAIVPPDKPHTNMDAVDVTVSVPSDVVGRDEYRVRLYVTVEEVEPVLVAEAAVGPTSLLTMPGVPLTKGRNDMTATIVGKAGESDPSSVVTYILDQTAPKVTISSPKEGAAVSRDSVLVKGKTQAESMIVLRNDANGATATTQAGTDGLFEARIALGAGTNGITVTATDPAGNTGSSIVTVRRGSGTLTASLTASSYRLSLKSLPTNLELVVTVTDPDGRALGGATALFTVSIPGLETIVSSEVTTSGNGTAVFRTRIPKGAQVGSGLASVLVTTSEYGTTSDREPLTLVK
jgi:hypothetical protein